MEDHAAIPFPDIDSGDLNNPLAAVTYVEDIYTFYRKIEVKFLHDTKKKKNGNLLHFNLLHLVCHFWCEELIYQAVFWIYTFGKLWHSISWI